MFKTCFDASISILLNRFDLFLANFVIDRKSAIFYQTIGGFRLRIDETRGKYEICCYLLRLFSIYDHLLIFISVMTMITKEMCLRLVELIEERQGELFPNSSMVNAERRRDNAWIEVADLLNKKYADNKKTVKQLQSKWKQLKLQAKEEVQQRKKYVL
jgi:hypothetical protein